MTKEQKANKIKEEEFQQKCTFAPNVAKSKRRMVSKMVEEQGRTSTGSINLAPILQKRDQNQ